MKKIISIILLCCFLVNGCATTSTRKLRKINLGMTKEEVRKKMGKPTVARGAVTDESGQIIEIWEYKMIPGKAVKITGHTLATIFLLGTWAFAAPQLYREQVTPYLLRFRDGILVQWGEVGDWYKEHR